MNIDLVQMLANLSLSLNPIQHFISGGAYVLGIVFLVSAITKIKKLSGSGHESSYGALIFFMVGVALLFLPTALSLMANTAFGTDNVLTYAPLDKNNVYSVVGLLVRTAGLLWFVRGCILLTHTSQPGAKLGSKAMAFIVAGLFAMNLNSTIAMLNTIMQALIKMTMYVKPS
ncbi:MAG: type IV secretion protein IcmC [Legionella sp.]|nr:type IV secretion protein IcmC [Legionella sp.]